LCEGASKERINQIKMTMRGESAMTIGTSLILEEKEEEEEEEEEL